MWSMTNVSGRYGGRYDWLPTTRFGVEPPVRIELTAYALQERCSTTELRRRVERALA